MNSMLKLALCCVLYSCVYQHVESVCCNGPNQLFYDAIQSACVCAESTTVTAADGCDRVAEVFRRIMNKGNGNGDVRVSLIWYNNNDIDLEIAQSAAYSSGDANGSDSNGQINPTTEPIEYKAFDSALAPQGSSITARVVFYNAWAGVNPDVVYVLFEGYGRRQLIRASISKASNAIGTDHPPYDFTVTL